MNGTTDGDTTADVTVQVIDLDDTHAVADVIATLSAKADELGRIAAALPTTLVQTCVGMAIRNLDDAISTLRTVEHIHRSEQ